jgi:hypothetical protein
MPPSPRQIFRASCLHTEVSRRFIQTAAAGSTIPLYRVHSLPASSSTLLIGLHRLPSGTLPSETPNRRNPTCLLPPDPAHSTSHMAPTSPPNKWLTAVPPPPSLPSQLRSPAWMAGNGSSAREVMLMSRHPRLDLNLGLNHDPLHNPHQNLVPARRRVLSRLRPRKPAQPNQVQMSSGASCTTLPLPTREP